MSALVTGRDRRPDRREDRREGGTWTVAQSTKNHLLAAVIRSALALAIPLPPRWLRKVGRSLGRIAPLLFRRANAIATANLALAFPRATTAARGALLRDVWLTLGEHLGDALASLDVRRPMDPLPIDSESLSLLRARGVVFVSAHLGPWERLAASLVHHGVPLTALAREAYDPRLSHVYDRLREARGIDVIYRGHPAAAMRIVRTLRAGRVLGIPMDLRSRVPSIDATFLGHPAPTPRGPARIALRTRSPVVVGTVAPGEKLVEGKEDPHALRITCTAIATEDLQADDTGERLLTERINAELTARILALPRHWVWMHDRFGEMNPVD